MSTVSVLPARRFLAASDADLRWLLIRADDATGQWYESARDLGQLPGSLQLDALEVPFSWHVRPMADTGTYRLTLLGDATVRLVA